MNGTRLKIPYPILVEGKYDKLRVECVAEAQILTTDGFGVFNQKEKAMLYRALAKKSPLIVLTDSDGAGKLIRSYLCGILPADRLIHLYIPRIEGVEKRKRAPSAEGTLGVEGMEQELLYRLLAPYADDRRVAEAAVHPLCKADLYLDGLTGKEDSAARRDAFAAQLGLPPGMTPNALLAALRMLCSYEEYLHLVGRGGQEQEVFDDEKI